MRKDPSIFTWIILKFSWVFQAWIQQATSCTSLQSQNSSSKANCSCCYKSDGWSNSESSIISIDSNITDNIIRQSLIFCQKGVGLEMKPWVISEWTECFCIDFPIYCWSRRPKSKLKIWKRPHFLRWSKSLVLLVFQIIC